MKMENKLESILKDEADKSMNVDEYVHLLLLKPLLQSYMEKKLTEQEREVLCLRYGLGTEEERKKLSLKYKLDDLNLKGPKSGKKEEDYTRSEIAEAMGRSITRIKEIELKALRMLRYDPEIIKLREDLYNK